MQTLRLSKRRLLHRGIHCGAFVHSSKKPRSLARRMRPAKRHNAQRLHENVCRFSMCVGIERKRPIYIQHLWVFGQKYYVMWCDVLPWHCVTGASRELITYNLVECTEKCHSFLCKMHHIAMIERIKGFRHNKNDYDFRPDILIKSMSVLFDLFIFLLTNFQLRRLSQSEDVQRFSLKQPKSMHRHFRCH